VNCGENKEKHVLYNGKAHCQQGFRCRHSTADRHRTADVGSGSLNHFRVDDFCAPCEDRRKEGEQQQLDKELASCFVSQVLERSSE
jgi:hypothetical protein